MKKQAGNEINNQPKREIENNLVLIWPAFLGLIGIVLIVEFVATGCIGGGSWLYKRCGEAAYLPLGLICTAFFFWAFYWRIDKLRGLGGQKRCFKDGFLNKLSNTGPGAIALYGAYRLLVFCGLILIFLKWDGIIFEKLSQQESAGIYVVAVLLISFGIFFEVIWYRHNKPTYPKEQMKHKKDHM